MKTVCNIQKRNAFIATAFFFVLLRVWWFFSHGIVLNEDSTLAYIPQSLAPFFSKAFFIGGKGSGVSFHYIAMKARAFSYPLFLKIFGVSKSDLYRASCGQFLISIFSWIYFSWVVSRRLNNQKFSLLLVTVIFLVGLTNGVVVWDRHIAAESLTISLFLLIIGMFLRWESTHFKCNCFLALLILEGIFFAGLRDTNPYFLVLLSIFSAIYYLWWRNMNNMSYEVTGMIIFFVVMLGCFFVNNFLLDKTERWHAPFGATFIGRLLCQTDQSAIHYFESAYHMPPVPASLQKYRGTVYGWTYSQMTQPPLAKWMNTTGRSAYTSYLLMHPYYALIVPWLPIKTHFARCPWLTKNLLSSRSGFRNVSGKNIEIDYQRSLLFSLVSMSNFSVDLNGQRDTSWPTIILIPIVDAFAVFALIATIFIAVKKRNQISFKDPVLIFSVFLFLCGLLLATFIWHADSTAYPRHLILVVQQLLLSIFMVFFFVLDKAFKKENN